MQERPVVVTRMAFEARQVWFWLVAFGLFLFALALFKNILLPFVAGIMLAYWLNPAVDRLQRAGLSRVLATTVIVGAGAFLVVAAVLLFAPMLIEQMRQLVLALPDDVERARAAIEKLAEERFGNFAGVHQAIDTAAQAFKNSAASLLGVAAATLWNGGLTLIGLVSVVLITPLVVFYLLVDWHDIRNDARLWLPRDHAATIEHLGAEINEAVAAFVRGQSAVCLILAVFYAVGLSMAGLSNGVIIGLGTGLIAFVPMLGWLIGTAVALVTAIVQFAPNWKPVFVVLAVLLAGTTLETAVLQPRLVGPKIGLHPVWLIFSLFAFSSLFGIVGTLVAVPVSAAIGVLARFGIARYLESTLYLGRAEAAAIEPMAEPGP